MGPSELIGPSCAFVRREEQLWIDSFLEAVPEDGSGLCGRLTRVVPRVANVGTDAAAQRHNCRVEAGISGHTDSPPGARNVGRDPERLLKRRPLSPGTAVSFAPAR
jgi:hypothetical protein